jgi:hypothetical protein
MITEVLRVAHMKVAFQQSKDKSLTTEMLPDLVMFLYLYNHNQNHDIKKERPMESIVVLFTVWRFVSDVQRQEMGIPEVVLHRASIKHLGDDLKDIELTKEWCNILDSTSHTISKFIDAQHWNSQPNFFTTKTNWDRKRGGRAESLGHEIFLAIILVREYLELAIKVIYGYSIPDQPWPDALLIPLRLTGVGWCPYEINALYGGRGRSYLSLLSQFYG